MKRHQVISQFYLFPLMTFLATTHDNADLLFSLVITPGFSLQMYSWRIKAQLVAVYKRIYYTYTCVFELITCAVVSSVPSDETESIAPSTQLGNWLFGLTLPP